jgi:glycosyltransferase involved in cell wall biosynthesis
MRILYLHQYFKTPEEGGAIRSYYLASAMVKAGHEVILLTSHNRKAYKVKDIKGIEVHYLPVFYSNNLSAVGRAKAFLRFLWQARRLVAKLAPYDFCYVSSTPLTIGLLALYARQQFHTPYIFEVRDLWPEAPIQLGYIKNSLLKKLLRRLEYSLYSKARAVVALSPGIARGIIEHRTPSAKVHLIPNMADCNFFEPAPINQALSRQMGTEGYFVISYLGAAGPANHLEYLLEAAQACQQHGCAVKFVVAAEGRKLESLKKKAAQARLKNIIFGSYGSKEQAKKWLSISHAVYTSFGPYPILQTNSPNKFFDGLAAGKLSIVNTHGWLKELVEENHCGFYAKPEKPEDFVKQLKPFLKNSDLLQEYQQNARRLAEERFSRELLSNRAVKLIEKTKKQL